MGGSAQLILSKLGLCGWLAQSRAHSLYLGGGNHKDRGFQEAPRCLEGYHPLSLLSRGT